MNVIHKTIKVLLAASFLLTAVASEIGVSAYVTDEFTVNDAGTLIEYRGDELVSIPNEIDGIKIRSLADNLFSGMNISTVYIWDGLEHVGRGAFENSHVTYVDFPATVSTVGDRALAGCSELKNVVLNSEEVAWGQEVFFGTGYLDFTVPCTADRERLKIQLAAAKGDENFGFLEMHTALTESMTEKDIYGENMFYCEDCGFKGSKYLEDITLPFEDVSPDAWYYSYVSAAYSFGILNGKSETRFDPNAGLTCAEAAKIAACIHAYQTEVSEKFEFYGDHWYDTYVDYCYKHNILEDYVVFNWDEKATRARMAYLFSRCDTEPYYINEDVPLTDIPDVDERTPFSYEILDLYRKGVAVGSNAYLAYYPDAEVKRSEVAALVSRILCWDMRIGLPKG